MSKMNKIDKIVDTIENIVDNDIIAPFALLTLSVGGIGYAVKACYDSDKNLWQEQNPSAEVDSHFSPCGSSHEADKKTDSLTIKEIQQKYLFQMVQYEQMLEKTVRKQQKADSVLLTATQNGNLATVKEALEVMGANVNAQDAQTGNTAIMTAKENLPFEKAFLIARYLVSEPGFNPDVENKEGISFMDMLDADLAKGSAAWQSISRKCDMLKPDTTRVRDKTEMDKSIAQLQKAYDNLMATYGKEMKAALGYHAEATAHKGYKEVINEDGSVTKYEDYIGRENGKFPILENTGKLEFERLNPQDLDIKELANSITMAGMGIQAENIQEAQQGVETTRDYNHGSIDAKTYMKVRGRRGSYSTVEIKTHVEGNKVR